MASKKSDILFVILLAAFLSVIIGAVIIGSNKKEEILNNGDFTTGKVIGFERIKSRGTFFEYEYSVNGKLYTRKQKKVEDFEVGKEYRVNYSVLNPQNSIMLIK